MPGEVIYTQNAVPRFSMAANLEVFLTRAATRNDASPRTRDQHQESLHCDAFHKVMFIEKWPV